jgi:hypothetical protein
MAFSEKSLFVWNDSTIGTPAQVAAKLQAAGFEGAYLHSTRVDNWRTTSRVALVAALKSVGIRVYASCAVYGDKAVYGYTPAEEGAKLAGIVEQYGLAGGILDVEKGLYETASNAGELVKDLINSYKGATQRPVAFCGWSYYTNSAGKQIHPLNVLREAMKLADVGMPMAYWYNGSSAANAVRWLETTYAHWRDYTAKPILPAGRAYNDSSGGVTYTATGAAVTAYERRARELGACGISWWSMEHAVKIGDVWAALSATPKWLSDDEPEEPPVEETNVYKTYAIGQYVLTETQLTNPALNFAIGDAGSYVTGPNDRLKPIEQKAASMGIPFIPLWDLDISYYEEQQYNPDDEHWPAEDRDPVLGTFKAALENRNFKAAIIRVMDSAMTNGKPHAKGYLNYAARKFCERASDWLWKTKKAILIIQTSHDGYIEPFCPDMANWAGYWDSCIEQYTTSAASLDASYPQAADKPRYYIGTHPDWDFWWYFNGSIDLYLFNGPPAKLAEFLGTATQPPADVTPPTAPTGLQAVVSGSTVTLSWQPSTDNVGVTGYVVIRNGQQVSTPTGTAFVDAGLQPGTYTYQVRATDSGVNLSALSDPVTVTIEGGGPGEPVDLTAVLAALARIEATLGEVRSKFS